MKKRKYIVSKKMLYMQKKFSTDDGKREYFKVKDHCHYTGKYRRAAHDI